MIRGVFFLLWLAATAVAENAPLRIRIGNLTVPPSTGPVIPIEVMNPGGKRVDSSLTPEFPSGWVVKPDHRPFTLRGGETTRLSFVIEKAVDLATNRYPVKVTCGDQVVERIVMCASAPFYKPKIDGNPKEWREAIPVTFATQGKSTRVSTYWNRMDFCLYVEVREDELTVEDPDRSDGLKIYLAPKNKSARYAFSVRPGKGFRARARLLTDPDQLEVPDSLAAVKRRKGVTLYEVAIPVSAIPAIKPTEGREFFFTVIVDDPDGTGPRDLSEAMNPGTGLFNEWGCCSSKH